LIAEATIYQVTQGSERQLGRRNRPHFGEFWSGKLLFKAKTANSPDW